MAAVIERSFWAIVRDRIVAGHRRIGLVFLKPALTEMKAPGKRQRKYFGRRFVDWSLGYCRRCGFSAAYF